jgi:cyclic pyranopterin phosphate synthase
MVDVSGKNVTKRTAIASATVNLTPAVLSAIQDKTTPKGDVFATARIAGITAAKKTPELIPLCHQIPLSSVTVEFETKGSSILITAKAATDAKTGVEMEALTAASIAALTLYDMVKGLDKGCTITNISLLEKTGGKSGTYKKVLK